jgi:hypothetical protein
MLHPRGPPAGDPETQTAGGLVRLSSVEAASAAIAALNERPSLTGPGGPPLLVRALQHSISRLSERHKPAAVCSFTVLALTPWAAQTSAASWRHFAAGVW